MPKCDFTLRHGCSPLNFPQYVIKYYSAIEYYNVIQNTFPITCFLII